MGQRLTSPEKRSHFFYPTNPLNMFYSMQCCSERSELKTQLSLSFYGVLSTSAWTFQACDQTSVFDNLVVWVVWSNFMLRVLYAKLYDISRCIWCFKITIALTLWAEGCRIPQVTLFTSIWRGEYLRLLSHCPRLHRCCSLAEKREDKLMTNLPWGCFC